MWKGRFKRKDVIGEKEGKGGGEERLGRGNAAVYGKWEGRREGQKVGKDERRELDKGNEKRRKKQG